jgi:hypothetical protein
VTQPTVQNDALVKALQLAALQSSKQPQQSKRRRFRRRRFTFWQWMMWRAVLGVVLTGLLAGGTAINRWYQGRDAPSRYPAAWDEKIVEYVDFVEDERDLKFEHPIHVEFFHEDDFVALFDAGDDADFQSDESEAQSMADLYDAAGLSADFDPEADQSTVSEVLTLGFYSPSIERIALRGEVLTPAVQAVLVHELTHALQDQNYTLETGGFNDLEVRAVVEADAMRIEDAYVATLPADQQESAIDANSASDDTDAALASVPWPVVDRSQAPYILGPLFIQHIVDTAGEAGLEQVFEVPPTGEELVDPSLWFQQPAEGPGVATPTGAVPIEPQHDWSKYDALVMLDAWLPWRDARAALDGWTAGTYASYHKDRVDGPACFGVTLQLDTPEQANVFGAAISSWALSAGSTAVPEVTQDRVRFEACPRPGGAADPPAPALMTSEALYLENMIVGQIRGSSSANPWYTCVARALIDDPTFAALAWTDDLTPDQQAAIDLAGNTARWVCGEPPVD